MSSAPLIARPRPEALVHTGCFVSLTPIDIEADAAELFAISHADDHARALWRYLPCGPFSDVAAHIAFLRDWRARPDVVAYTVHDHASGRRIGSISLMAIRAEHGVAELGNIWYAPSAQRTKANTEACHLLLKYCFEQLGYRRMEWKCNTLNTPSRRAALRLGFTFEGTFRQHMIVKGENRDTAWFSMLDHEWPRIASAHERWLRGDDPRSLGALTAGAPSSA